MNKKLERVIDFGVLVILLAVFYSLFDFSLALTNTNVAGGDMISHPWIYKSLRDQWLSGNFWSWNHGWFAGFPFLYFYFYPIYIIATLLNLLGVPEAMAFKCMVLIVVSCVPFFYYVSARRWLSIPMATLFTTMGVAIFLNEFDSRWGGNFKSLLAGQMSHQFGLVMMMCFFSYLATKQTSRAGAIVSLSLAILSHVYSALFSFLVLICYLFAEYFETKSKKRVFEQTKGPFVALCLTSFFWLPFLYYRNATVAPINHTDVDFQEVLRVLQIKNILYLLMYLGAFVAIIKNIITKKKYIFSLVVFGLALSAAASMPFLSGTPLLHIRLPAEIYLLSLFAFTLSLSVAMVRPDKQWFFIGLLSVLVTQSYVPSKELDAHLPQAIRYGVRDLPHWWKWNMSGIEEKANHEEVTQVWDFIKSVDDPEARFAVEYFDYNQYGSPRIFELTPFVTGKPIMEGLLLESSPTYPTYFYISFLFNQQTWWPGFPVTVPDKNPTKGVDYFGLFNVKYFIAHQEETRAMLKTTGFQSVYENKEFSVFKINDQSRIASRIVGEVPAVESSRPLMQTVLNYPMSLDSIIEVRNSKVFNEKAIQGVTKPKQEIVGLDGKWSSDGQQYEVFNTEATESSPQNILFKISYFPNWRASTGEEVKLVTPNLMMVTTKSPTLILTYRPGWPEKISLILSLAALCMLLWRQRNLFRGARVDSR